MVLDTCHPCSCHAMRYKLQKAKCTSQSPYAPVIFLTITCGFNYLAKQYLLQHLQPAGGISSRKCELRNADKSQIPRGSQGFLQTRCSKGSLELSSLALCSCISLEQGWAPRWVGGGMCLWMNAWHLSDAAQEEEQTEQEIILGTKQ